MDHLLLSIVMPVYNAQNTLIKAVRSVESQELKDWELILVDDGSSDGSGLLCDQLSKGNDRIRVIHQKNCGPSAARNAGITSAIGTYIAFIDSDDWIDPKMYAVLLEDAQQNNADMVMCGFVREFWSETKCRTKTAISLPKTLIYDKVSLLQNFNQMYLSTYIHSMVNKVYRLEILINNKLRVPETLSLGEDLLFNLQVIKYCKMTVIESKAFYHYIHINTASLTSLWKSDYWEIQKLLFNKSEAFIKEFLQSECTLMAHNDILLRSFFIYLERTMLNSNLTKSKKYDELKNILACDPLQKALNRKGAGGKEFFVYRIILKTNTRLTIFLFTYMRYLFKRIIRG